MLWWKPLKIREIHEFFKNLAYWNNWSQTCDGFLWGDPDRELEGIAVCWSSMRHQLEIAIEKCCNLYITHEPLYSYVRHGQYAHPAEERKAALLRRSRIVVYRCHDVLDMMPEIGIPESWARFLGFDGPPAATRNYYRAYDLPDGSTARQVASGILARVREIGQDVIHMLGPQDKSVSRIVVGTGAITDFRVMAQMGDLLLLTDDGTRLWESAQWSADTQTPLLVVNHATAEEPGVKALAGYLGENLDVPVHFIPQGCLYKSRWD
jgi:putative NIF3 family GTP cyclohydrolase 1 type 2